MSLQALLLSSTPWCTSRSQYLGAKRVVGPCASCADLTHGAARSTHGSIATRRLQLRCGSVSDSAPEVQAAALSGQHVMLCVVDGSQYLSDGSKEALREACSLVRDGGGRLSVFVANLTPPDALERSAASEALQSNLQWHLSDRGVPEYSLHVEDTPDCVSASLSDVADEREADVVVLSSSVVHSKQVDANLLAEFCPCRILMLP